jgi:hypothetical protein
VAGVEAVESTSMPKLADSVSISVCDKTLFISSENLTRVDLCNALVPDADKTIGRQPVLLASFQFL